MYVCMYVCIPALPGSVPIRFYVLTFIPYRPLARPWECSESGGQNNKIVYMRMDLNFKKRKFLLFYPPDWLQSHDVQGSMHHGIGST